MSKPKPDYKAIAEKLAPCVLWALKYLKVDGGGGLRMNMKTGEARPWEDTFMDALDACGYVIDRKEYRASREKRPKRKARKR